MNKQQKLMLLLLFFIAVAVATDVAAQDVSGTVNDATRSVDKFTKGKWFIAGVNALILMAIAWIVIAMASSGKDQQTGKLIVILLLAGTLAFFLFVNKFKSIYLWKIPAIANLMHVKVIINIAVAFAVFAVLFMILQMFWDKIGKIDNKQKVGLYIIFFFIAFYLAVSPIDKWTTKTHDKLDENYPYIWEQQAFVGVRYYLFGDPNCKEIDPETKDVRKYCYKDDKVQEYLTAAKENKDIEDKPYKCHPEKELCKFGVLMPPQLFILVVAIPLLLWLFNTWKIFDGSGWIKYFLSIIIAVTAASNGLKMHALVVFAQIISMIIIFITLKEKKSDSTNKFVKFSSMAFIMLLAFLIPIYVVNIVHQDYAIFDLPDFMVPGTFGQTDQSQPNNGGSDDNSQSSTTPEKNEGITYNHIKQQGQVIYSSIYFWLALGMLSTVGAGILLKKKYKWHWAELLRIRTGNKLKLGTQRRLNYIRKLAPILGPAIQPILQMEALKLSSVPGEEPEAFKMISSDFMVLMNYLLRLQVYYQKLDHVEHVRDWIKELTDPQIDTEQTFDKLHREMEMYKTGSQRLHKRKDGRGYDVVNGSYVKRLKSDGEIEFIHVKDKPPQHVTMLKTTKETKDDEGKPINRKGWLNSEVVLYTILETARDAFENPTYASFNVGASTVQDTKPQTGKRLRARKSGMKNQPQESSGKQSEELSVGDRVHKDVEKDIGDLMLSMKEDLGRFMTRFNRYRRIIGIHAAQLEIYDQYLMEGVYTHFYQFARPGARCWKYTVSPDRAKALANNKEEPWPMMHSSSVGVPNDIPTHVPYRFHEVNRFGYFTEDINDCLIEGTKNTIRRVRREDIIDIPFHIVMNYLYWEWKGWIDDLYFGLYHPKSHTIRDYEAAHRWRDIAYHKLSKQRSGPSKANPAFDREAMKDPGKLTYWGRKKYWWVENLEDINNRPFSPEPAISARGISKFIVSFIDTWMKVTTREDRTAKEQHMNRMQVATEDQDEPYAQGRDI